MKTRKIEENREEKGMRAEGEEARGLIYIRLNLGLLRGNLFWQM